MYIGRTRYVEKLYIYIYIYVYMRERERERETISNVTQFNKILLDSYFENLTVGFYILYLFNEHAKFHIKQMLLTN